MIEILEKSWNMILLNEFEKPYYKTLISSLEDAYGNKVCFPPKESIFKAFELCPFNSLKVVIIGQDPYHGQGQATGLAFSVNDNIALPPSLRNIFKEMTDDLSIQIPLNGKLNHWAEQGILLLNSTLTVEENKPNSHQKFGWENFTNAVIDAINQHKENVVFLLWGAFAHKKGKNIDLSKHFVLKAKHPSPLSANFGGWFGQKHFSQTNTYLESVQKTKINW